MSGLLLTESQSSSPVIAWAARTSGVVISVSSVSERSRTLGVCGTELHWNLRGLLFSHYASWPWMDVSCGSVVWGATLVPWQNANQAHQSSENEKIGKHAFKKTQEKTQQKIQRLLVFSSWKQALEFEVICRIPSALRVNSASSSSSIRLRVSHSLAWSSQSTCNVFEVWREENHSIRMHKQRP